MMKIEVTKKPALRVAALRYVGPYMEINRAFEKLGEIAGAAGLLKGTGTALVGVYYDDPQSTAPDQLRADAGVTVSEDARIPVGLTELRLRSGTYACVLHVGPYDGLGDVWQRLLGEWVPASGKRVTGPGYERYLNTPGDVPPEQLRTEICVPVT